MSKKLKIKKCVYCGEEKETTRDHVISRNLFHQYNLKKPIIVFSCAECNKGFSLDEEYFRIFVCSLALEHSRHASALFFSKIKRSIQRRPKIGYKIMNQMELVDVYTKSRIWIGKRTKIHITKEDWNRYFNILNKYIKGLFFHKFKKILPNKYKIKHFYGEENMREQLKHINKWNFDNEEIFAYGFNFIPNTFKSIWATIFYDSIFFISCVATEDYFKRFDKLKSSK